MFVGFWSLGNFVEQVVDKRRLVRVRALGSIALWGVKDKVG